MLKTQSRQFFIASWPLLHGNALETTNQKPLLPTLWSLHELNVFATSRKNSGNGFLKPTGMPHKSPFDSASHLVIFDSRGTHQRATHHLCNFQLLFGSFSNFGELKSFEFFGTIFQFLECFGIIFQVFGFLRIILEFFGFFGIILNFPECLSGAKNVKKCGLLMNTPILKEDLYRAHRQLKGWQPRFQPTVAKNSISTIVLCFVAFVDAFVTWKRGADFCKMPQKMALETTNQKDPKSLERGQQISGHEIYDEKSFESITDS